MIYKDNVRYKLNKGNNRNNRNKIYIKYVLIML